MDISTPVLSAGVPGIGADPVFFGGRSRPMDPAGGSPPDPHRPVVHHTFLDLATACSPLHILGDLPLLSPGIEANGSGL